VILSRLSTVAGELLGEPSDSDRLRQSVMSLSITLNGISGRYLREVLQGISDIKEAVACALSCRFLEAVWEATCSSSAQQAFTPLPVVVPLDDHWSRIRDMAAESGVSLEGDRHADIMLLTVLTYTDRVQIWPRFIEVKYRSDGQVPSDAYEQVSNSWKAFCGWQSLSPQSIDSSRGSCLFRPDAMCNEEILIRSLDLACVLELAIDRTMRFFPGFRPSGDVSESKIEEIKNKMLGHVYRGQCEYCFDVLPTAALEDIRSGEEIVAGDVVVVGPFTDEDDGVSDEGLRPVVRTTRLGRSRARELTGFDQ